MYQIPKGSPAGAQMPRPQDREPEQMTGGGGGWALVELTDPLHTHWCTSQGGTHSIHDGGGYDGPSYCEPPQNT